MSGDERVRGVVVITGRVQGVFFRASALEEAQRLGLTGWVKNLPDGGVEVVVEGPRSAAEELVAWCGEGPPSARVDDVRVSWSPSRDEFTTFRIER